MIPPLVKMNYDVMRMSRFDNLHSTVPVATTVKEVFAMIWKDQALKTKTELHRAGMPQKQSVPVFVPSALMEGGRKQENIHSLTGLIYFDYDHLTEDQMRALDEALSACTNVLGFYRSLGGEGIHVLTSYQVYYHDVEPMPLTEFDFANPARSQRSKLLWNAIWEEVRRQFEEFINALMPYTLHVDEKCKDVARPSALAHDPQAKLFVESTHPFTVVLSKALFDYEGSKPHVATGNPVGRPAKSQVSRTFDAAEAFARSKGCELKHGMLNKFVNMVICEVNRYGIAQDEALAEAKDRYYYYGDGQRGITSIVRSVYRNHEDEFDTRRLPGRIRNGQKSDNKKATSADIEDFLLSQGEYRTNIIAHRQEVRWHENSLMSRYHQRYLEAFTLDASSAEIAGGFVELHDSDIATLVRLLFEERGLKTSPNEVYNVLQSKTCSLPYNPILEYLRPLQDKWKPGDQDYLLDLARTIEVEGDESTRSMLDDYFTRWMVGMVHGWIHMKSTHGTILTLIGPQGIGKSSWMRMLLPPELKEYYKEQMRFHHLEKDDRIQLAESALINLEEIDAMNEADANQLKALATLAEIRERLPYGKTPVTMPRIATFCATGNRMDFMTDPTGNRRWLAFAVRRFTVNPFEYRPDYEHIYAQALFLAQHEPERFVMSQSDIRQLEHHNESFQASSIEAELCGVYVHAPEYDAFGELHSDSRWYTAAEIAGRIQYYQPGARLNNRTIGIVLSKMGIPTRRRKGIRLYLAHID